MALKLALKPKTTTTAAPVAEDVAVKAATDYRELAIESDEIEADCYRSCLTLMRQIQAYQKEHGGDLPDSECVPMEEQKKFRTL